MIHNIHPELFKRSRDHFGNDCELTVLPELLSKNLVGWCAIQEDLKQVLDFLSACKLNLPKIIYPSLIYSIVGLYGKCFTDASQSDYPKLEPNDVFKDNAHFLSIHNEIMDLRHRFLAHRGNVYANQALVLFYNPDDKLTQNGVKYVERKLTRFSDDSIVSKEELIRFLLKSVNDKVYKKGKRLYNKIFDTISENDFNQMPKIPRSFQCPFPKN